MTFKFNPIDWQALLAVLEMLIFLKILFEIRSDVKSRREHREALSLNFYTYFWNRFDKILENLPSDFFDENFDFSSVQNQEQLKRTIRSYFQMCSQEYYLYKKGKISHEIWTEWENGMKYFFNIPSIIEHYETLGASVTHQDFQDYVQKVILIEREDQRITKV